VRKRLWVLLLLLLIPAVNSYSINKYIYDTYYSDATFTTGVGDYEHDCDGTVYTDGTTTTNYRYHYEYVCDLDNPNEGCQEWDSSLGRWVYITCP
jgi:hypothetical protein